MEHGMTLEEAWAFEREKEGDDGSSQTFKNPL